MVQPHDIDRHRGKRGAYETHHDCAQADGNPAVLIAAGFPDGIAQRRGEPGAFRLAGGSARLTRTDPLAPSPLLAVTALERECGRPRKRLAR